MTQFDWSSFSTPKSVSQQYDVSYSGGLGKTTFFGGSQSSSGPGANITSTFKNITGALGGSGMSALNSVKNALGGLLGAGDSRLSGGLKDSLGVAEPFLSNVPTGKSIKDSPASFTYPADPGKIFMMFEWKESVQTSPIQASKKVKKATIALPLSVNLQETFSINYSEKTLGAYGLLQSSGVLDAANKAMSGGVTKDNAASVGAGVASGISNLANDPNAGKYLARQVIQNALPGGVGAAFDRATGKILNPYAELQLDGVGLREHTFTYTFSPNSEQESKTLKNIIKEFRKNMHPGIDNFFYTFPNLCQITIVGVGADFLYQFKPAYLKTMSVNYAPSNVPSFYKGGEHPTEIQLSLTFGEKEPLSADSFK